MTDTRYKIMSLYVNGEWQFALFVRRWWISAFVTALWYIFGCVLLLSFCISPAAQAGSRLILLWQSGLRALKPLNMFFFSAALGESEWEMEDGRAEHLQCSKAVLRWIIYSSRRVQGFEERANFFPSPNYSCLLFWGFLFEKEEILQTWRQVNYAERFIPLCSAKGSMWCWAGVLKLISFVLSFFAE
jgi:hypothetical protein